MIGIYLLLLLPAIQTSLASVLRFTEHPGKQLSGLVITRRTQVSSLKCTASCILNREDCQLLRKKKLELSKVACEFLKLNDGTLSLNDYLEIDTSNETVTVIKDVITGTPSAAIEFTTIATDEAATSVTTTTLATVLYKYVGSDVTFQACLTLCTDMGLVLAKFNPNIPPQGFLTEYWKDSSDKHWLECENIADHARCSCTSIEKPTFTWNLQTGIPTMACKNPARFNTCVCVTP